MSDFDSPLGKKTSSTPSNQVQRKVYSVPAEQDHLFEIPGEKTNPDIISQLKQAQGSPKQLTTEQFQELQDLKQKHKVQAARPSSEAKLRVDLLTGIGRLTKDVKVGDHTFTLQSLKARELKDVFVTCASVEEKGAYIFEMRAQTLARALLQVDGHDFGTVLGSNNLDAKLYFLDESEEFVVATLYTTYSELSQEQNDRYGVKNDSDVKKIIEDVKKA